MSLPKKEGRVPTAVPLTKPRTGVFTLRSSARQVSRCVGYEFEDAIIEDLEPGSVLIEPSADAQKQIGLKAKHWLQRRNLSFGAFDFGARTMSLGQDLDLFFTAPALPQDLLALSALSDWRQRSRHAVCYLQELWISEFDRHLPAILPILNQFDQVFVALYHTAEALSQKLDVPVEHLPLGVDTELWNPYLGKPKARVIDACAIGHMDPVTHGSLWDWAEKTGRYYSFTTSSSARIGVPHKMHRQNLAQTLQRSKFFFTYMAKRAVTGQRSSQEEFGPRYFEGAAAGAIQVGDAVKTNPSFLASLDWDGAVVEAPFSSTGTPAILEELERNADWLEGVRRTNVANCLTRHDHLNRWDMVLKTAGLDETPAMAARRARLKGHAESLKSPPIAAVTHRSQTL